MEKEEPLCGVPCLYCTIRFDSSRSTPARRVSVLATKPIEEKLKDFIRGIPDNDESLAKADPRKIYSIVEKVCKTCHSFLLRRANVYWMKNPIPLKREYKLKKRKSLGFAQARARSEFLRTAAEEEGTETECIVEDVPPPGTSFELHPHLFLIFLVDAVVVAEVVPPRYFMSDAAVREIIAAQVGKWYVLDCCYAQPHL